MTEALVSRSVIPAQAAVRPRAAGPPPHEDHALESVTVELGRAIFREIPKHAPSKISPARLDDLMMQLLMRDEDLRYRMLRFVDVYPALRTAKALGEHLEEFLTSPELATVGPGPFTALAQFLGRSRPATRGAIRLASRLGISRMGRQFIAGNTPEEVAKKIRRMEREGFLFSLDLLGEFVVSESQADHFAGRYLEMVERFGSLLGTEPSGRTPAGPRVNISIKLSSLTSKFEPMDPEGTSAAVRERLRPLVRAAQRTGAFINVDMEKYEYRDLTLQILLDLLDEPEFRGFPHLGTVHQAYLKDALPSLEWFLGELRKRGQPLTIRLVKGAYWDSEQIWARAKGWPIPVIMDKRETDASYERCLRMLIESNDIVRTAVASHNVRSIAHAMALAKAFKVPADRFEYQMLYGMAGPIKDALRAMGYPVRIYTPCGELLPGMAYLVRRILENTSNESFLRQRFAEGVSEEKLLSDPKSTR
ncbi:hypothetical protein GC173_10605 [bacterium]|nr:hypothetical protein [bacterium]